MYYGDVIPGAVINFKFTTVNSSGAPTAFTGGEVIVYKDATTGGSTSGITTTSTFASVVGLNHVQILTTANSTFYAAGSNFQVVISSGTVSSQSFAGYLVKEFSISNRSHVTSTGYPANFAAMVIGSTGAVDGNLQQWRGTQPSTYTTWLASTEKPTNWSNLVVSTSGVVDANVELWRDSAPSTYNTWLASTDKPTNFSNLVVTTGGIVDADVETWRGTVPSTMAGGDMIKADISLSTGTPANFTQLAITTGGIADADVETWRGTAPSTYNTWLASTEKPTNFGQLTISTGGRVNLGSTSLTDINAEVVDALDTDLYAEPSSAPAASNASLSDKVGWVYALSRQGIDQNSTSQSLINSSSGATATATAVIAGGTSGVRRTQWA